MLFAGSARRNGASRAQLADLPSTSPPQPRGFRHQRAAGLAGAFEAAPGVGSGDSRLTHGRGALTVEQRDQLVTPDADSGVRVDPPSRQQRVYDPVPSGGPSN